MYKVCNCFFLEKKKNQQKQRPFLKHTLSIRHCATTLRVGDKLHWGWRQEYPWERYWLLKCQEPVLCDDLFPGLSNILKTWTDLQGLMPLDNPQINLLFWASAATSFALNNRGKKGSGQRCHWWWWWQKRWWHLHDSAVLDKLSTLLVKSAVRAVSEEQSPRGQKAAAMFA